MTGLSALPHIIADGLKIFSDRNVADFKHRVSFAKKPRLGPRDTKSRRTWKMVRGRRVYGWRIWYHSPIAYVLRREGELVGIVSPETYAKLASGEQSTKMLQKAAKLVDRET